MLVRRTEPVPFECVVRGYISGSAWKEYRHAGTLAGEPLPAGLRESDRLAEPIFSPATKAEVGHDENVTFDRVADALGTERAAELRDRSLALYEEAQAFAASARDHHRGHQVRVRSRRRPPAADRRGPHARLVALLAGGRVPAGQVAAELRQAAGARLPGRRCARPGSGTGRHPPLRCRPRWCGRPASGTATSSGACPTAPLGDT